MDWAIVVGVDREYGTAQQATGARRHALAVTRWLLDTAHVHPRRIRLLLGGPTPLDQDPPVHATAATTAALDRAQGQIWAESEGARSRLFWFFSGHGFSTLRNREYRDGLVLEGLADDDPDAGVGTADLLRYWQLSGFDVQFFSFDACRDVADGQDLPAASPLADPPGDAAVGLGDQFVFYTTNRGPQAVEAPADDGSLAGLMTRALLGSLEGDGQAKRWNPVTGRYEVTWSAMFDRVRRSIVDRGVPPPIRGADYTTDAVLADFPDGAFPPATLQVHLDPPAPGARIRAVSTTPSAVELPATQATTAVDLPPRDYTLSVVAPDHDCVPWHQPVALYHDAEVTFAMHRHGAGRGPAQGKIRPTGRGHLAVTSRRDAFVQLHDPRGRLLAADVARATAAVDEDQTLVGSVELPDGSTSRQLVTVWAGFDLQVELHAPGPAAAASMVGHSGLDWRAGWETLVRLSPEPGWCVVVVTAASAAAEAAVDLTVRLGDRPVDLEARGPVQVAGYAPLGAVVQVHIDAVAYGVPITHELDQGMVVIDAAEGLRVTPFGRAWREWPVDVLETVDLGYRYAAGGQLQAASRFLTAAGDRDDPVVGRARALLDWRLTGDDVPDDISRPPLPLIRLDLTRLALRDPAWRATWRLALDGSFFTVLGPPPTR